MNWPYPYPNTTFIIPLYFDTFIHTQRRNVSDASVDKNYVASSGLYQSTNHSGNKLAKIMMIHSHLRHLGRIIYVIPILVLQSPLQPHHYFPY